MAVLPLQLTHTCKRMRQGEEDLEEGPLRLCFLLLIEGAKSLCPPTLFTRLFRQNLEKTNKQETIKKSENDLKPQNIIG